MCVIPHALILRYHHGHHEERWLHYAPCLRAQNAPSFPHAVATLLRAPNWNCSLPNGDIAGIGESNSQGGPTLLLLSVSFTIAEPSCASFDLTIAADGQIRSVQLNGNALHVPSHGFRATTVQAGVPGLMAARGRGLFARGTNSLVVMVAKDGGATGFYASGSVQLLCPLHEATISMQPGKRSLGHPPLSGWSLQQSHMWSALASHTACTIWLAPRAHACTSIRARFPQPMGPP